MRLTRLGSLVTSNAGASENYESTSQEKSLIAWKTIGDFAEFIFRKNINQSQWFITSVVRNMFCIRWNPNCVTNPEWILFAVDHHFPPTTNDVVHLGWLVRVPTWWATCTDGNFCQAHDEFRRWHRVTTNEFPPSHTALRFAVPFVLFNVGHSANYWGGHDCHRSEFR